MESRGHPKSQTKSWFIPDLNLWRERVESGFLRTGEWMDGQELEVVNEFIFLYPVCTGVQGYPSILP